MSEKNNRYDDQKQVVDREDYKEKEKELQTGDKKLDGPNRPST